jgi:phosphoribosyl-ATP pyrophosphohydrolase
MGIDTLAELYKLTAARKNEPQEGSYTCYLFEKGLDKILKKVAEESGEVLIAAKNGDNAATVEELADLVYHLLVLMAQQGIAWEDLVGVLERRRQKIGNLKTMRDTDRET